SGTYTWGRPCKGGRRRRASPTPASRRRRPRPDPRKPTARPRKPPPDLHPIWRPVSFPAAVLRGHRGMSGRQRARGTTTAFRHSHAAAVRTGAHTAVRVLTDAAARLHHPAVSLLLQSVGDGHGLGRTGPFRREYHGSIHFVLPKDHGPDRHVHGSDVQTLAGREVIHDASFDGVFISDVAMAARQSNADQHGKEASHALDYTCCAGAGD